MALALIACAAAVVMVPEVRCMAGLDSPVRCADLGATPLLPTVTGVPVSTLASVEDPRVVRIRSRFRWIEENQSGFLFQDVPLGWRGVDSATATVYVHQGEIPKIRVRLYSGARWNSLLFYYTAGSLDFVHQVNGLHVEGGPRDYEQRFYFDAGRMFQWLGPDDAAIPAGAPGFAENDAYLTRLAPHLLKLARQAVQGGA
ncbi:MAG TPA: hypothetical protein VFR37_23795 [Longimicrobium sp.]|nr:hypothetical protein [Longimicrobium sp.]